MTKTPPRILVLTNPEDEHAFLVAEGLRRKGCEPRLCHTSDFPGFQSLSVRFDGPAPARGSVRGPEIDVDLAWPDVVWRRRPVLPVIPDIVHPLDRAFAERESTELSQGFWRFWSRRGFWVNPPQASSLARSKIVQHEVAQAAGFTLPATLYSNDPDEVREFIAAQSAGCVYKTLAFPAAWRTADGGGAFTYTSCVRLDDLPEPDLLRAVPGIYQALVPKLSELRVTVMGASVFAAELESQSTTTGRLDWRRAYHELTVKPYDLPVEISRLCREVTRELGLVFGCIDLIVTPEDGIVFLEINEMGQFLWVEDMGGPPLLDAFCDFLLSADPEFQYSAPASRLRAADLWPAARKRMAEARAQHVVSPRQVADEGVLRESSIDNGLTASAASDGDSSYLPLAGQDQRS